MPSGSTYNTGTRTNGNHVYGSRVDLDTSFFTLKEVHVNLKYIFTYIHTYIHSIFVFKLKNYKLNMPADSIC